VHSACTVGQLFLQPLARPSRRKLVIDEHSFQAATRPANLGQASLGFRYGARSTPRACFLLQNLSCFVGIRMENFKRCPICEIQDKRRAKMAGVERTSAGLQMIIPGCERRTLPKSNNTNR
jgi:hypothetical protein